MNIKNSEILKKNEKSEKQKIEKYECVSILKNSDISSCLLLNESKIQKNNSDTQNDMKYSNITNYEIIKEEKSKNILNF